MLLHPSIRAQLSPGELHESHAFLEGVENCSQCHGTDRKLAADRCLICHTIIKEELGAHSGLHGGQGYKECQTCHVEHQGRKVDLIYWKSGQKNLDHAQTGFALIGKHAAVECRSCHLEKFIKDRAPLARDKVTLSRTFLGLDTACVSCHVDEHRGQVALTCGQCHNSVSWKPAPGFDHSKTKYALTGKHVNILCAKCHPSIIDSSTERHQSYLKLTPIPHDQCTACHADAHKGKLGDNCSNCHTPEGWHVTDAAKFDHRRTRYPLEGKHAAVTCNKCHSPGKAKTDLRFGTCRDCHTDFHQNAFAKRTSKGACEECHSVAGYSPARFLLVQHDSTDYPLRGAHRAVPCVACHKTSSASTQAAQYQFRFVSTKCLDCHRDPHHGEVKKYVKDKGCEFCHVDQSWTQVTFDHDLAPFHLEGKHRSVTCAKCHTVPAKNNGDSTLTFAGPVRQCQNCHEDVHRGQLAAAGAKKTECKSCHTAENWRNATFDHNRSARFKLEGAHKNVPCQKCHRPTVVNGKTFVAYKPLDITCASCHGASSALDKEKRL